MKKILSYFQFCVFFIASLPVFAQTVRLDIAIDAKYPVRMSKQERKLVERKVDSLVNLYAQWGTLIDPKYKKVTDAAATNFYKLFSTSALILRDYEENVGMEQTDPKSYANAVFSFLTLQGVQFKIEKAYIEEIFDDKGFYVVTVILEKALYTMVDGRRNAKTNTGRFMEQIMKIDVPKSDFSRLKITQVTKKCKGRDCLPADSYSKYTSAYIGGTKGLGLTQFTLNSAFTDTNDSTRSLNIDEKSSWRLGFDWMSNSFLKSSSRNKNIFATVGLRFEQRKVETNLFNFNHYAFDAEALDANVASTEKKYKREVRDLYMTETATFTNLALPIGVSFRLNKKLKNVGKKVIFYLDLKAIPTLTLFAKNEIYGRAYFNGFLNTAAAGKPPQYTLSLLRKNTLNPNENYTIIGDQTKIRPFDIGGLFQVKDSEPLIPINNEITYSNRDEFYDGSRRTSSKDFGTTRFTLAAQFSPTVYYDFSENDSTFGLMFGIDINYQILSFYKHNSENANDLLKYQYGYYGSLPNHFTDKLNLINMGVRVGVYKKISRQP
jgi:hypothetical protein